MEFMHKHTYFELSEFIRSDIAKKKGLDNSPTFEIVANLEELVEKFLDPLRAAYGLPIKVTSGFRCPALNKAVGGSSTSVHLIGYAADLVPVRGSFESFRDFVVEWVIKTGTKFDQIIIERDAKTKSVWLHVGLKSNSGQQRGQIKVMTK